MSSQILFQASPNFIMRTVAGSTVLVAVGAGVADFRGYIRLNGTACEIWQLLKNKTSEDAIVDALFEIFEVSKEELAADVHETLEMMCAKKMVMKFEE